MKAIVLTRSHFLMTRVHDFAVDLAKLGKTAKEIKQSLDVVYPDSALSKTAIYDILKKVKAGQDASDQRHSNPVKTVRTPDFIEAVKLFIEQDRRVTVQELKEHFSCSRGTIQNVLHNDLGLVKKSARWVPKLLSDGQKEERARLAADFKMKVEMNGQAWLKSIVTMDESAVALHTPETKEKSKQWLRKGTPGPIKARVHSSREHVMVLAFFDSEGMIYTRYVAKGTKVNAIYVRDTLARFRKALAAKRPQMVKNGWRFHWDNAPVHTAEVVRNYLAKHKIEMVPHPPYSPDLAPADFFLFPKGKTALSGRTLARSSFQKEWERVVRSINTSAFANAYQKWYERCVKCVQLKGDYVEKN